MRRRCVLIFLLFVFGSDAQILTQSVTQSAEYVSPNDGTSALTFAQLVRQRSQGNFVPQCPCVRLPGSNKCLTYDTRYQAATIEEAMLAFVDLSMDPRIFEQRTGGPIAPATFDCATNECRQCVAMLSVRLRQIGLLRRSLSFPFSVLAAEQIIPSACPRLRMSRSIRIPIPPNPEEWAAIGIARAATLRDQFSRRPKSLFAVAVQQALNEARSSNGQPLMSGIIRTNGNRQISIPQSAGSRQSATATGGQGATGPQGQRTTGSQQSGGETIIRSGGTQTGAQRNGAQSRTNLLQPNVPIVRNQQFPQQTFIPSAANQFRQTFPQSNGNTQFSQSPQISPNPQWNPQNVQWNGQQWTGTPQQPWNGGQQFWNGQPQWPGQGPAGLGLGAQVATDVAGRFIPNFNGVPAAASAGGNWNGGNGGFGGAVPGWGGGIGGGAGAGGAVGGDTGHHEGGGGIGIGGGFGFGRKRRQTPAGNTVVGDRFIINCVERGDSEVESSDFLNLCTICWTWRQLPENYFPRLLNEIVCQEDDYCLSGWGTCHQRYRNIDILQKVGNDWRPTTTQTATCCDCKVKAGSEAHALVTGQRK